MNVESHDIVRTAAQDLVAISRAEQRRASFGVEEFSGFGLDIWRTSELTWLDRRGNPKRGDLTVTLSCNSMNMVESKSMKLFLMAFAMVQFDSKQAVERTIKEALKNALDADCDVDLNTLSSGFTFDQTYIEESHRLDYIPLGGASFEVDKDLLAPRRSGGRISGKYHTDLFRCLCPISSQPDYATIVVSLKDAWFSAESLLAYLLSYRTHQGFHESTIERIYQDINEVCEPKSLSVLGSFARRGGIDISPFRSLEDECAPNWRSGVS